MEGLIILNSEHYKIVMLVKESCNLDIVYNYGLVPWLEGILCLQAARIGVPAQTPKMQKETT
jgi:hypothetical protein